VNGSDRALATQHVVQFQTVDYGKDSAIGLRTLQMEWFDQWLKARTRRC
jgi:hypothetical protein